MVTEIRPMSEHDVPQAEACWAAAFEALRVERGDPPVERSVDEVKADRARFSHLLRTDPEGSFVALVDRELVGLCQALRRGTQFVLSKLGVDPAHQDAGIGRRLLEHGLSYARPFDAEFIFSSTDPRALHSYVRSGFTLHPAVRISGRRHPRPPTPDLALVGGSDDDLDCVDAVDQSVRGSTRREDVKMWLGGGAALWLHDGGGYAIVNRNRVTTLAAVSEEVAIELLAHLLCGDEDRDPAEAGFIPESEQWAFRAAAACGSTLQIHGAVLTRNLGAFPHPYLANPLLG